MSEIDIFMKSLDILNVEMLVIFHAEFQTIKMEMLSSFSFSIKSDQTNLLYYMQLGTEQIVVSLTL